MLECSDFDQKLTCYERNESEEKLRASSNVTYDILGIVKNEENTKKTKAGQ